MLPRNYRRIWIRNAGGHTGMNKEHEGAEWEVARREHPRRGMIEDQPIEPVADEIARVAGLAPLSRSAFSNIVSGQVVPTSASADTSRIIARCAARK